MNKLPFKHLKMSRVLLWLMVLLTGLFSAVFVVHADDNDFLCEVTENGKSIIKGYTGSDTKVKMPLRYNGITITLIDDSAFMNNKTMTEFVFTNYVTDIGAGAFAGCDSLESVNVPDQTAVVRERTFQNCTGLLYAFLGQHTVTVEPYAFDGCISLRSLEIDAECRELKQDALRGCDSLHQICFKGTEADWKQLTIGEGNEVLQQCEVIVNFGADNAYALTDTEQPSASEWEFSESESILSEPEPTVSEDSHLSIRQKASYTKVDVSIVSATEQDLKSVGIILATFGGLITAIIVIICISAHITKKKKQQRQ